MEIIFIILGVVLVTVVSLAFMVIHLRQKLSEAAQDLKHRENQLGNYKETVENLYEKINSYATEKSELLRRSNRELDLWKRENEATIRADALSRSRAVIRGQTTEHLAPYMIPGLKPTDYRFLGNPIDYLIINSGSAVSDRTVDEVESVILLDIKTGKSQLSRVQRRIRDAVVAGRVKFCVYNSDTETLRTWPEPEGETNE